MKNFFIHSFARFLWCNNLPFLLPWALSAAIGHSYLWCSEHLCRLDPPLQDTLPPILRGIGEPGVSDAWEMGRHGGVAIKDGGWDMWRGLTIERRGCNYETASNKMERMVMPGVGGENACSLMDSYGQNECPRLNFYGRVECLFKNRYWVRCVCKGAIISQNLCSESFGEFSCRSIHTGIKCRGQSKRRSTAKSNCMQVKNVQRLTSLVGRSMADNLLGSTPTLLTTFPHGLAWCARNGGYSPYKQLVPPS